MSRAACFFSCNRTLPSPTIRYDAICWLTAKARGEEIIHLLIVTAVTYCVCAGKRVDDASTLRYCACVLACFLPLMMRATRQENISPNDCLLHQSIAT